MWKSFPHRQTFSYEPTKPGVDIGIHPKQESDQKNRRSKQDPRPKSPSSKPLLYCMSPYQEESTGSSLDLSSLQGVAAESCTIVHSLASVRAFVIVIHADAERFSNKRRFFVVQMFQQTHENRSSMIPHGGRQHHLTASTRVVYYDPVYKLLDQSLSLN